MRKRFPAFLSSQPIDRIGRPRFFIFWVLSGFLALSGGAGAATCPGTPSVGDRVFTLNTSPDATCLDYGAQNLNGNNDVINQQGFVTIDKSDDTNTGVLNGALTLTMAADKLSGSFSISAPGYSDLVLAFKSGVAQADPDWVAFLLPVGIFSGTWAISGQQGFSHANLYGVAATSTVPLPAGLPLLIGGLGLLGFLGWRRQSSPTALA
jgi:hypothetical protein